MAPGDPGIEKSQNNKKKKNPSVQKKRASEIYKGSIRAREKYRKSTGTQKYTGTQVQKSTQKH